ncbi:glucose-6-phosphate isomerase [Aurantimicrobium minutum]|uniref:Glucose-6-phosphate isomerase n=1 Tax=Aurantimicrobium minutum TaxID=708131 RepID=A0A173LVG5_9MICO|nr:glucose-6-phosphate isomerase [Aurantimicrobium minutum]BAU98956.1 glucose-6-phosphate isomerase [Aurantimicrobium minutum]
MSFRIKVSGAAEAAVEKHVPQLVSDMVASSITAQDPALWGAAAEAESAIRLGWTESVAISRPLVAEIEALRDELREKGVNHIVLGGMGGSSLAPEVITATMQAELTVLDSTEPGQIQAAITDRLHTTAVVISSKSGGTVETDSQKRIYEAAFAAVGIDPLERIIVVTDPGSPLDKSAREAGYRVFNADPNVGGRFSALTAFGLVPSGLAGVDIAELLNEAEAISIDLAVDQPENPGLILGAAIAGTSPLKNKLALVTDGTHLVGFPDWAEQLIAESTGKEGTGILPVVLDVVSPELSAGYEDVQVLRLVDDAHEFHLLKHDRHEGEILVSGTLGAMFLVFEYATAVAGRLLGINPFDQPDVESAKVAARALLDNRPAPTAPLFTEKGIEVRAHGDLGDAKTVREAITAVLKQLPSDGYVSIQAYIDRVNFPEVHGVRDLVAARAGRPVTFGWGPRFLHSTGQFHKGGPAVGVFIQILQKPARDVVIPERPFTFGELIAAQAAGDAAVLAEHGRPVLTLTLTNPATELEHLFAAFN